MLSFENVTIAVNDTVIIKDFSCAILAGQCVVLQGPNGSGKSSLVNALIGNPLYQVLEGLIVFGGSDLRNMQPYERVRLGIFVAMQQQFPIPGLLIKDYFLQLYATLYNKTVLIDDIELILKEAFAFVGLDQDLLDKSLFEGFSGGQKKRFELAHLLIFKPRLIVLDEIDSGLDADGIAMFIRLVERIKKDRSDAAFLIITHNVHVMQLLSCNKVISLGAAL